MDDSRDLRKILSQNIRAVRVSLHISQAKLAKAADISIPYLADIERCRTWVSDKTLNSIARALNMEPYELLIPEKSRERSRSRRKNTALQQTAGLIKAKKGQLRKSIGETMDNLILEIVKLHGD